VELRLLGTTEVVTGGTRPPLGGPRQRAVLADLALHAGRALVTSQLVEDLWGESPPASAVHTVEAYISRLRRAFFVPGEPSVLLSTGLGYLLDVSPSEVHALQFGQLSAAGRRRSGEASCSAQKSCCRPPCRSGGVGHWRTSGTQLSPR
jgi:DNA-binding SARP family transcriptional activator